MPAYLQNMMLRLAEGIGQLDERQRARHGRWLKSLQRPDGGFAGREGNSDLYYTSFALRSLALLGELQGETAERAAGFLKGRLSGEAPIIDFLSLVYGAALLDNAAGLDVFADVPTGWRISVADTLERFRRPDGGYAKTDAGQSSSTYNSFLFVLANQLLQRPLVEPERLVEFVRSRQREDGGFVEVGPMRHSGTNPTAAAAGLLTILEAFDDATREATIGFLTSVASDEGGLKANTRIPIPDVLSTFTGVLTLTDLGALDRLDAPAALRFVRSMELEEGGFLAGEWDNGTDVEYTFYALGALALLTPRQPVE